MMEIQKPGGHLDQLIRQTRAHHAQLSSLADSKANMMMTVSSLLIPLCIVHVQKPEFKWAALTLISFCVITVIFGAYAAMPKVPLTSSKKSRIPNMMSPEVNMLFFGSFSQVTYEEFEMAMENVMNDVSRSYETQVREVYILGTYLAKNKYRFVRLAYLSFLTGICVATAVYVMGRLL